MATTMPSRSATAAVRAERMAQRRRFAELGHGPSLRAAVVMVSAPPPWATTWSVFGMLAALPDVGHHVAFDAMLACRLPNSRDLGGLDPRERRELCLWLEARAAGHHGDGG